MCLSARTSCPLEPPRSNVPVHSNLPPRSNVPVHSNLPLEPVRVELGSSQLGRTTSGAPTVKKTTPDRSRGRREGKGLFWEPRLASRLNHNMPRILAQANALTNILGILRTIVAIGTGGGVLQAADPPEAAPLVSEARGELNQAGPSPLGVPRTACRIDRNDSTTHRVSARIG